MIAFINPFPIRTNGTLRCATGRLFRKSLLQPVPVRHTQYRGVICAASQKPPAVKSSFYKNPSKAIEKGGGFFIPGLRGPRLRVFVAVVAISLLTVNHIASIRVAATQPQSFFMSEVLALFAVTSVAASAYLDLRQAESAEVVKEAEQTSLLNSAVNSEGIPIRTDGDAAIEELMSWTGKVAMDLTPVDSFSVFDTERMVFATDSVTDTSPGKAVARVAAENKAIYISDSRTLPSDVDFPFLTGAGDDAEGFSVYMVPAIAGKIVAVFAVRREKGKEISSRDRAWLRQCVERIGKAWA